MKHNSPTPLFLVIFLLIVFNNVYPKKQIGLGLNTGFLFFQTVGIDYQKSKVYGYLNYSYLLPLLSKSIYGIKQISFGSGIGLNIKIKEIVNLELTLNYSPLIVGGSKYEFSFFRSIPNKKHVLHPIGIGSGIHFNFESGFNILIKVPLFGIEMAYLKEWIKNGEWAAGYYVIWFMAHSVFSMGYRF